MANKKILPMRSCDNKFLELNIDYGNCKLKNGALFSRMWFTISGPNQINCHYTSDDGILLATDYIGDAAALYDTLYDRLSRSRINYSNYSTNMLDSLYYIKDFFRLGGHIAEFGVLTKHIENFNAAYNELYPNTIKRFFTGGSVREFRNETGAPELIMDGRLLNRSRIQLPVRLTSYNIASCFNNSYNFSTLDGMNKARMARDVWLVKITFKIFTGLSLELTRKSEFDAVEFVNNPRMTPGSSYLNDPSTAGAFSENDERVMPIAIIDGSKKDSVLYGDKKRFLEEGSNDYNDVSLLLNFVTINNDQLMSQADINNYNVLSSVFKTKSCDPSLLERCLDIDDCDFRSIKALKDSKDIEGTKNFYVNTSGEAYLVYDRITDESGSVSKPINAGKTADKLITAFGDSGCDYVIVDITDFGDSEYITNRNKYGYVSDVICRSILFDCNGNLVCKQYQRKSVNGVWQAVKNPDYDKHEIIWRCEEPGDVIYEHTGDALQYHSRLFEQHMPGTQLIVFRKDDKELRSFITALVGAKYTYEKAITGDAYFKVFGLREGVYFTSCKSKEYVKCIETLTGYEMDILDDSFEVFNRNANVSVVRLGQGIDAQTPAMTVIGESNFIPYLMKRKALDAITYGDVDAKLLSNELGYGVEPICKIQTVDDSGRSQAVTTTYGFQFNSDRLDNSIKFGRYVKFFMTDNASSTKLKLFNTCFEARPDEFLSINKGFIRFSKLIFSLKNYKNDENILARFTNFIKKIELILAGLLFRIAKPFLMKWYRKNRLLRILIFLQKNKDFLKKLEKLRENTRFLSYIRIFNSPGKLIESAFLLSLGLSLDEKDSLDSFIKVSSKEYLNIPFSQLMKELLKSSDSYDIGVNVLDYLSVNVEDDEIIEFISNYLTYVIYLEILKS